MCLRKFEGILVKLNRLTFLSHGNLTFPPFCEGISFPHFDKFSLTWQNYFPAIELYPKP